MATPNVERLLQTADSLDADELLEAAQQLIERARVKGIKPDINALAGSLVLDEDPMAIQERMRREWD